jgi:hypothetical protein
MLLAGVTELKAMKNALARLIHCCQKGATLECPIIEELDGTEERLR